MAQQRSSASQQISELTQKLRRQEIQLARLKTRKKRAAESNQRLKIRLGELFYQVNAQALNGAELERTIAELAERLRSCTDIESYCRAGEEWIKARSKSEKAGEGSRARTTADGRQQQLDHKTKSGELMLRCQLHRYNRPTLLGAMLALHVNDHLIRGNSDQL